MSHTRRERARSTAKTLASLGALVLLAPPPPVPALAEEGWLRQEPGSADRIGLVLESGALRLDGDAGHADGIVARWEPEPRRGGLAVFPPQPLEAPADTVDVRVRTEGDPAEVDTELRGGRADGAWTEWHPVGGGRVTLPHEVARVQLRVRVSGEGNGLTGLRIRPLEEEGEPPQDGGTGGPPQDGGTGGPSQDGGVEGPDDHDDRAGPFSATLFATRIGLVGNTTANGHRIRENDHFAALPSRRGLAVRGGGEYTVRVCTTGALGPEGRGDTENHRPRCAYLPVWDVGPWNTRDDHWNAERETWPDLARGRPQAQAAYTLGHNGGLDGFGRRVSNPAGIDLADGAFRQGLELPTNGWVRVDYLWTGEYRVRARITSADQRHPVVVRGGPGLEYEPVGLAAHSANVDVACQAVGDAMAGTFGTSRAWYRIGEGDYVPAVFADGGSGAPACPEP
ncbi:hypothetical protein MRI28_24785 [Nocardiopsis dassonvillei]|uniref:hypothetical protein n=1 Tax=Nocardiopsis dassonvillei TaxID=2014 RepID=UPI00200F160E|nr:hypothetical protein [Nocardiopsis dassonvillei]MCK9872811.1 hypothetical protein [Nocardiopsis dassonvillei]